MTGAAGLYPSPGFPLKVCRTVAVCAPAMLPSARLASRTAIPNEKEKEKMIERDKPEREPGSASCVAGMTTPFPEGGNKRTTDWLSKAATNLGLRLSPPELCQASRLRSSRQM